MPFKLKKWTWPFRHEPVTDHTRGGTGQVFEGARLRRRPAARESFDTPAFGFEKSVAVPIHTGHDLGRGLALQILKQTGFTPEDFLKWR
jgi:hypothetical protein